MSPLISVIMPSFNSEKFIRKSIESILNQTLEYFEFIIVDNLSKDKTWEIIQEYALKDSRIIAIQNKEPLNIAITLNRSIELAKGKYIARMDTDDISFPDRLQKQADYLDNNPDVVLVGSAVEFIDENNNKYNKIYNHTHTGQEINKFIRFSSPLIHPTWMVRTDIIKKIATYRDMPMSEDYDLLLRLVTSNYKIDNILIQLYITENGEEMQ